MRGLALLLTSFSIVLASTAVGSAQTAEGFRLDRYLAPPTTEDGLALQLPTTLGDLRYSFGLVLDYAHAPLVLSSPDRGASVPLVSQDVLQSLTVTERLGVEALRLRATPEYTQVKANRPREGHRWDMPGCAGAPTRTPRRVVRQRRAPSVAGAPAPAPAGAAGTSDWLQGSVACGVVIVNGPTAATQFTADEQTKVVAEVQAGASWLAGFNPWAGVSFDFDIRVVSITTQPDAVASNNEARFRDPAVAQLGFQANWNGVGDYVNGLRSNRHTNWAYCVFFVKGYPLDHFA